MLTDPEGRFVSLSTKSYRPTDPIWRHVVAEQPTCAHPGCDRPSVECELDHIVEWPLGETSTTNLQPLCRRHHKAKHARAERPDLDWEYNAA
jgi:5-methylcytosine-specific restriction endonuclease McrA